MELHSLTVVSYHIFRESCTQCDFYMASGAFAYGTVEIPNEKKYCSKLILVKKDRSLDE